MNNSYILIIGANGLFGTAIEGICKENRARYSGLTHNDLEISDENQLESKVKEYQPDVIVNAAAMMGIPACEKDPKKAFDINSVSALNLAKICQRQKIVLVQTSTNAVFDGKKGEPYVETDNPNPQNIYGLSKYAGEICVRNNLDAHYIIRFPKLFGSRKNNTPGFIDKMIEKMRKGEELKIADDRIDPFTYTIHAARKVFSLVKNQVPFGIYHVANQGSVSYYDFVCEFANRIGYSRKIARVKDSDFQTSIPNPLRTELTSTKIHDMASWQKALDEYVTHEKIKL